MLKPKMNWNNVNSSATSKFSIYPDTLLPHTAVTVLFVLNTGE